MPNYDFGTLEVRRHATPPAFPQFGISREDEQNDLATVHHESARAYATLFAESPKLLDALDRIEMVGRSVADIMHAKGPTNDPLLDERLSDLWDAANAARAVILAATEDIS